MAGFNYFPNKPPTLKTFKHQNVSKNPSKNVWDNFWIIMLISVNVC